MIPQGVGVGLLADRAIPELVRAAREAEEGGCDGVWVPDERFFRDTYAVLAALAAATGRVRLGPCVTDPFSRHPALTAMAIGTINEISGGRAVLGMGTGISGFSALGITPRRTVRAIREAVELIRALLREGTAEAAGEVFTFRGKLDFQAQSVPVFIAGRGPKVLELAGEIGDGVILGSLASPGGLAYAEARLAAGAARAGRDPGAIDRMIWLHTYVHEDGRLARRSARRIIISVLQSSRDIIPALDVTVPPALARLIEEAPYGYHWNAPPEALALVPDPLVDAFTAAGTPEEVAAAVGRLHRAGIRHVAFRLWASQGQQPADVQHLVLDQVLPRLGRVTA
ncbi:MAG TPA: LLM class flavin-dependent oxidoreductase [bacterium]|nr:LLM class flavin-dependent oxidoreductase [bacterium]